MNNNQKEFLPPVVCVTCGKILVPTLFDLDIKKIEFEEWKKICKKYNIKRICCKRMYISNLL